MTLSGDRITLGALLEEEIELHEENAVLERVKLLAQRHLPDGWTSWRVVNLSKEEVFGEEIDPQMLNKLRFALPTIELVQAFFPDAADVSEKMFRKIKIKLLDWAFTRALIMGPPAIANRIRGSAAQTEIFNKAVVSLKPLLLSQKEASRTLSFASSESEGGHSRKRQSSVREVPVRAKVSKLDLLEQKIAGMFEHLAKRIDSLEPKQPLMAQKWASYGKTSSESDSDRESVYTPSRASSPMVAPPGSWQPPKMVCDWQDLPSSEAAPGSSWKPPKLDMDLDLSPVKARYSEMQEKFEFRPTVKEAEPLIPEPDPQIEEEGVSCHRFGSQAWFRIRYKEAEKSLLASPVFSALKVNTELGSLEVQSMERLKKQDGLLGAFVHGLLKERKALAEQLKDVAAKYPEAAQDLLSVFSEGSKFKAASDTLLQFACGHRAETIEFRRKFFKTRNDALRAALQQIPPSRTHLFDEKILPTFIKDHGGISAIFPSRAGRFSDRRAVNGAKGDFFRKPTISSKSKQPTWRSRSSTTRAATQAERSRGSSNAQSQPKKQRKPDREIEQRHRQKSRRY